MVDWKIDDDRGIGSTELASFNEFTAFIGHQLSQQHNVVFRGQRKAEWGLSCTLRRFVLDNVGGRLREHEVGIAERTHRDGLRTKQAFKLRSRYFNAEWHECNDVELWALLQHHGGKTPLLDWSRSPYVAAFWAYADVALNVPRSDWKDGRLAVWGLGSGEVLTLSKEAQTPISFLLVEGVLPTNRRLAAQQGLFTFTDPLIEIDRWIQKNQVESVPFDRYLWKIILPWEDTDQALTHLNRMNINFATMFPDLGGAALHATLNALFPGYEGLNPPEEDLIRSNPK